MKPQVSFSQTTSLSNISKESNIHHFIFYWLKQTNLTQNVILYPHFWNANCHVHLVSIRGTGFSLPESEDFLFKRVVVLIHHQLYVCFCSHVGNVIFGWESVMLVQGELIGRLRSSHENNGPTLWNTLPKDFRFSQSVSSFRSALKTHLFPT